MLISQIPAYFKSRRDELIAAHPGGAFLFPAHPSYLRNGDVHYPYRQESNFVYLSGWDEAESFLVLSPVSVSDSVGGSTSKAQSYQMTLFVQPKDPEKELWEGERYGIDGAKRIFGADQAFVMDELSEQLPRLLEASDRVFYRMGLDSEQDSQVLQALATHKRLQGRSGRGLLPIEDSHAAVAEMRLFKRGEEVELMRRACEVSAKAHVEAMKQTRPGQNEAEVEALVDYQFRKEGCRRLGYPSIVASGKNATCLHYRSNNEQLRDGDLLLIDAGGEYDYYTSDITRTFPVSRQFSQAQRELYAAVLLAQKEAIAMVKPGETLSGIHRKVCEVLIEQMISLGLLKGTPAEIMKSGAFRQFYPHSTSHWLGMDVHDAGLYQIDGKPRKLEPGMILTIEPGLYVQPKDESAPLKYRGIGIRIEDDVLVTAEGCEVLTSGVPKEIEEIEALRR